MLGSDFELFMKVNGEHIPVPDTLDIGDKFGEHTKLGAGTMHRDNIMVELCPAPVMTSAAMVRNVKTIVNQAEDEMSKLMGETVTLSFAPTMVFGSDALASQNAQELGCDTDWLARNGLGVERLPLSATKMGNIRCSGGHIHLSYGATSELPPAVAVHFADVVLGTLEATMGKQGARRYFYGIEGLYRSKTYGGGVQGVEYRTTSNLWLADDTKVKAMATNALSMEQVLKSVPINKIIAFLHEHWPTLIAQGSIVRENKEECRAFLVAAKDAFPTFDWATGE